MKKLKLEIGVPALQNFTNLNFIAFYDLFSSRGVQCECNFQEIINFVNQHFFYFRMDAFKNCLNSKMGDIQSYSNFKFLFVMQTPYD